MVRDKLVRSFIICANCIVINVHIIEAYFEDILLSIRMGWCIIIYWEEINTLPHSNRRPWMQELLFQKLPILQICASVLQGKSNIPYLCTHCENPSAIWLLPGSWWIPKVMQTNRWRTFEYRILGHFDPLPQEWVWGVCRHGHALHLLMCVLNQTWSS